MNEKTTVIFSDGQKISLGQLFTDSPDNDWRWTRLEQEAEAMTPSAYDAYEEGHFDEWDLMSALGEEGMRAVLGDDGARFFYN